MTTIDTLCAESEPNLIKIDIEGAELLALKGAYKTLTRSGTAARRRNSDAGYRH